MELIDKAAMVAEIIELDGSNRLESPTISHNEDYKCGYSHALEKVRDFIDTLEVKEVDFEKELESWRHNHFHGRRDIEASGEYLERTSQLNLAKYFFELGLKVQKGE